LSTLSSFNELRVNSPSIGVESRRTSKLVSKVSSLTTTTRVTLPPKAAMKILRKVKKARKIEKVVDYYNDDDEVGEKVEDGVEGKLDDLPNTELKVDKIIHKTPEFDALVTTPTASTTKIDSSTTHIQNRQDSTTTTVTDLEQDYYDDSVGLHENDKSSNGSIESKKLFPVSSSSSVIVESSEPSGHA
jgi:hypothetical protein